MEKRFRLYIRISITIVIIAIMWIVAFKFFKLPEKYLKNIFFYSNSIDDDYPNDLETKEIFARGEYLSKKSSITLEFCSLRMKSVNLIENNMIGDKLYNTFKIAADLEVIIDRQEELLNSLNKLHPSPVDVASHKLYCESYESEIDNNKSLVTALRLQDMKMLNRAFENSTQDSEYYTRKIQALINELESSD